MSDHQTPVYKIDVTLTDAWYLADAIKPRVEHLRKRLAKNPKTPNARQLRAELWSLEDSLAQAEIIAKDHLAKLKEKLTGKTVA